MFVGHSGTVYEIASGSGFDEAAAILGEGFAGVLERDGWVPYRRFEKAGHQICYAHILRRSRDIIASAQAGAARVPHAVRRLVLDALQLRDQRDAGALAEDALDASVEHKR